MKLIIILLLLLPVVKLQSQDMRIVLSAKKEKLSVRMDQDNSNRSLMIKSVNADANNYFIAAVLNEVIDTTWKRTFTIHNNTDSEIAVLTNTIDDKYCISLKELIPKLKIGNEYYLYTIALPTDPKKAMLVKVARTLVCKIIMKN